jgi:hypothetical protein
MASQDETFKFDYYNNAVIPPPLSPSEVIKYTRIAIDSKTRDKSLFPNANKYEIKLNNEVSDVMSAKLINADIPMSMYLINQYFDTLVVTQNGTTQNIQLEHGDYNEVDLATMITDSLNNVFEDQFAVSYNKNKDNFTFRSKTAFTLTFGTSSNSLDALLGFDKAVYTSTAIGVSPYNHVITGTYRKNFTYNNCVIMYIDQFDCYHSPANEMDRCFAILPSVYSLLSISDHPELIKTFSPPIPRLTKLIVKFLDRFGNLYDFNNLEHRFELLLTSHKQGRRYNSIFT